MKRYRILTRYYNADKTSNMGLYFEKFKNIVDAEFKMHMLEQDPRWAGTEFWVIAMTSIGGYNELEENKGGSL